MGKNAIKKNKVKLIIFIILILFIAFVCCSLNVLTTTKYSLSSDKLTEKIKIVVISDLHSSEYGKNQNRLLKKVKAENPDLILMTGDVIDDQRPTKAVEKFFYGIQNLCPAYYVYGNHELRGDYIAYSEILSKYGIILLNNDLRMELIKGQRITVCGLTDPQNENPTKKWKYYLSELDRISDNESYKILLSHRPHFVQNYKETSFDLILCGHEHGGQWRIFNKGLYAPNEGLFPKYSHGVYTLGNAKMIVSSGLCKNWMPRFLNKPEIVSITIDKSNS